MTKLLFAALTASFLGGCADFSPVARPIIPPCATYHEQVQGVWEDELGVDRIHFILGSNASESGCFATLTQYRSWGFDQYLHESVTVKRAGQTRSTTLGDAQMKIDLEAGSVTLVTPTRTVTGRVLSVSRL